MIWLYGTSCAREHKDSILSQLLVGYSSSEITWECGSQQTNPQVIWICYTVTLDHKQVTVDAHNTKCRPASSTSSLSLMDRIATLIRPMPINGNVPCSCCTGNKSNPVKFCVRPVTIPHMFFIRIDRTEQGTENKINAAVTFPSLLETSSITPKSLGNFFNFKRNLYCLRGVICHHGCSVSCGHYTAFIRSDLHSEVEPKDVKTRLPACATWKQFQIPLTSAESEPEWRWINDTVETDGADMKSLSFGGKFLHACDTEDVQFPSTAHLLLYEKVTT